MSKSRAEEIVGMENVHSATCKISLDQRIAAVDRTKHASQRSRSSKPVSANAVKDLSEADSLLAWTTRNSRTWTTSRETQAWPRASCWRGPSGARTRPRPSPAPAPATCRRKIVTSARRGCWSASAATRRWRGSSSARGRRSAPASRSAAPPWRDASPPRWTACRPRPAAPPTSPSAAPRTPSAWPSAPPAPPPPTPARARCCARTG
mmetsp:Transcript_44589/g.93309  ORF Transcript_44589/g.93309 Transcript_44589/m.93309 type:complete len:207 (+) Transcript_44589:163-783(+)